MLNSRPAWFALLCACAVTGIAGARLVWAWRAPRFAGADISLRDMAEQHLGSADALPRLRTLISRLPTDHGVIFFAPVINWDSSETYLLASDLAWPREVRLAVIGQPPPPMQTPVAALVFFNVSPPAQLAPAAHRIGTKFSMVILPDAAP